jgi:hypothetical protein
MQNKMADMNKRLRRMWKEMVVAYIKIAVLAFAYRDWLENDEFILYICLSCSSDCR